MGAAIIADSPCALPQRVTGGDHRGKDDGKERGRASDAGSNADTDENAPTMEPMPIMVAPKMLTSRFNVPAVISVRGSGYLASRSRGTHDRIAITGKRACQSRR